jgi:hypothetical protein
MVFQMEFVRMLKIQRKANGRVLFTLSGRIESEDLDELRKLLELEGAGSHIALDLKDVTLVDRDAMKHQWARGRRTRDAIQGPVPIGAPADYRDNHRLMENPELNATG